MILWLRSGPATGSAIAEEGFHYVYREIKDDVQLATISGANELNGCIALGNPFGPVYPGKLSVSRSRDEGRGHSLHHQHEESGACSQERHHRRAGQEHGSPCLPGDTGSQQGFAVDAESEAEIKKGPSYRETLYEEEETATFSFLFLPVPAQLP